MPENPYTLHAELQQSMNDLVGIIRKEDEIEEALAKLDELRDRLQNVAVEGGRLYNPGWHLAIDMRNMLLVSECVAKAALQRTESRGGHTRDDHPAMDANWRNTLLVCKTTEVATAEAMVPRVTVDSRTAGPDAAGPAGGIRALRTREVLHRRRTDRAPRTEGLTWLPTTRSCGSGGATTTAVNCKDYTVEVNEGEVVLDIIHRLQATQANDLAVRWNCKAGKCGSCSAEINGRPRLLCMTRMSTFGEDETVTVTPLRTFPVMRDLVTDVSFNYEKARQIPSFTPPKDLQPGEYRMQQEDVNRSQEFRKCIECFLCQNVCHVVRDHEENKESFAGPRFLMRHRRARHAPAGHRGPQATWPRRRTGWACATSPSAAPRSAPSTSRSPTTRLIPMKERVADRKYDPVVWLGNKLFPRRSSLDSSANGCEVHLDFAAVTFRRPSGYAPGVRCKWKPDHAYSMTKRPPHERWRDSRASTTFAPRSANSPPAPSWPARRAGRDDAAELERRIDGYRDGTQRAERRPETRLSPRLYARNSAAPSRRGTCCGGTRSARRRRAR